MADKRRTALWIRRALWITVLLAVVVLVVMAAIPKPAHVEVARAHKGEMRVTVLETGHACVIDRYVISSPLSGDVQRITLHAGDPVTPTEVLARMMPMQPPLLDARTRAEAEAKVGSALATLQQTKSAVIRAEAAAAHAREDAAQNERLVNSKAIAPEVLEQSRLDVRLREAELQSATFGTHVSAHDVEMAQLALTRLKSGAAGDELDVSSPITGRVLKVMQQSAGIVNAGAPLLEVGDPAALEIVTDVLTADAVRIRPRAVATIERWGGAPLAAHVRLVEPSAFTRLSSLGVEEQRVNVVLDLDEPRDKWVALGDNYRVEARIVVWLAHDAVTVPLGAIFRHGDDWAVYAAVDGHAHLTPITVGERNDVDAQILNGLGDGATVIVHPTDAVKDGVRVAFEALAP